MEDQLAVRRLKREASSRREERYANVCEALKGIQLLYDAHLNLMCMQPPRRGISEAAEVQLDSWFEESSIALDALGLTRADLIFDERKGASDHELDVLEAITQSGLDCLPLDGIADARTA